MPCFCANKSRNKYVPRSGASDTDEYDHLMQSYPISDYSGRSSPMYENSSTLDDQAWNDLSSLRQKACRFITSETEETPTEPPATECPRPRDFGYGNANPMITANDWIDYFPQSEFLKKMKQKCKLLCANMADICSSLDESFRNDSYDSQMSNEPPRMGENPYNSEACGRVRFSQQGMDGCEDEMLYENASYDHHCSTDEKLLDGLIDRKLSNNHSAGRPKSATKKAQHISRSKKPSKCRGRRKRKSGKPEKCESENQFEPTLKKPHENSCERCWRYASPSRSPVNKPDQKYDPNFRRGHSCYDFEGGDEKFYDIHVSPWENLQPITSREKQQLPETVPANTLAARQLSSSRLRTQDQGRSRSLGSQRSPDAQPQAFTPTRPRSPEVRPQTCTPTRDRSLDAQSQAFTPTRPRSPEVRPQTYTPTRDRFPDAQSQAFTPTRPRSPEVRPQTYTPTRDRFPDAQTQAFTPTRPRSPEVRPQTCTPTRDRSPDAQSQAFTPTRPRSPEVRPQTCTPTRDRSPDAQPQAFTSADCQFPEPPPQRSVSISHRSPEAQLQTYTTVRQKTPEPQHQSFSSSYQLTPQRQSQSFTLCDTSPEAPPQRGVSPLHKSPQPEIQTYTTDRPKTPEPQPFSPIFHQTPEPQLQSFSPTYYDSLESPPQGGVPLRHKSPVPQPQTYTTCQPKTPEPQPFSPIFHQTPEPQLQSFSPAYYDSLESPPQGGVPLRHKSPVPQPQTYTTCQPKTPEPQSSTYHQTSGAQPQTYTTFQPKTPVHQPSTYHQTSGAQPGTYTICQRKTPEPESSTYHDSIDSPPQRGVSLWHKSPVRQPGTYTTCQPKTPEPESSTYHDSLDSPPQRGVSLWHKSPVRQPGTYTTCQPKTPVPQSSTYHQTSGAQPGTYTICQRKTPEPESSTYHDSIDSPPQRGVSLWHKSPVRQPGTYTTCQPKTPEPESSTYHDSIDSPPQRGVSLWHKSPVRQPGTYTTCQPKTPVPQSSTYLQTSGAQPGTYTICQRKTPEPESSTYHDSIDSPPQRGVSLWHKSPVRQPGTYTICQRKTPEPESSTYHDSLDSPPQRGVSLWHKSPVRQPQRSSITRQKSSEAQERQMPQQRLQVQRSQSPATPRENDYCYQSMRSPERGIPSPPYAVSNTIDSFDVSEYKTICPPQRRESANSSLSARQLGNSSQTSAGGKVYSPSQLTPKPGPVSLETIPEAAGFESCKCKTPKGQESNSKTPKEKSCKSPARQGTIEGDSTRPSNSKSSPNRRSGSPNKSSQSSQNKPNSGGSPNKSSKSPNRSGNGSTRKCKQKHLSPKPGSSMQGTRISPEKKPQKSLEADPKTTMSLTEVNNRTPRTPGQRPQSSDPRREVSPRKIASPDQYLGADHHIRYCACDMEGSFPMDEQSLKHVVCCHCDWENHPTLPYSPKSSGSKKQNSSYKGFDGRAFECPHRRTSNTSVGQPDRVNSSFGRDCRLLSEVQNTASIQSSFQGMSPIPSSPKKYFMFYMTKCKENKGDDDVEVLVEELTQACPKKTDSRTKDITDKMKKIMECPSDSMALKFQKGVSDLYKTPQSSRVLYF